MKNTLKIESKETKWVLGLRWGCAWLTFLAILGILAFWGAVIYAIVHFIFKCW